MDILYTLGDGSNWGDSELKYSLRSVARFCRGVGDVYLVGTHKPAFVGERVKFLKIAQKKDAARNVQDSISAAIEHFGLGHFLLSSDDHFYVKPADFENYPYYTKGILPREFVPNHFGSDVYTRTLMNTRKLLELAGLPFVNYGHHINVHITADAWRKAAPIWEIASEMRYGVSVRSVVNNIINPQNAVPRKDCKIMHAKNTEDIKAQIGDSECFSIYDSAISEGVADFLARLFPEPCIYERQKNL